MRHTTPTLITPLTLILCAITALAANKPTKDNAAIEALKPLRDLVGDWRGVGLPKRGSTQGAWQEKAAWSYAFDEKQTALTVTLQDGKFFKTGRIQPGDVPDQFVFIGTLPDGKTTERYIGGIADDGDLIVDNDKPAEDRPDRITFKIVAQGDRLIMLMTRKIGNVHARLAQVGYTREGSGFGGTGVANECVVTGGESSRTVEYKGKKYYVCCSGCADYFNKNPEEVLAEYRAKKEKEAKEKEGGK